MLFQPPYADQGQLSVAAAASSKRARVFVAVLTDSYNEDRFGS